MTRFTDLKGVTVRRSFNKIEAVELSCLEEIDLVIRLSTKVVVAGFHHAGRFRLLFLFL